MTTDVRPGRGCSKASRGAGPALYTLRGEIVRPAQSSCNGRLFAKPVCTVLPPADPQIYRQNLPTNAKVANVSDVNKLPEIPSFYGFST